MARTEQNELDLYENKDDTDRNKVGQHSTDLDLHGVENKDEVTSRGSEDKDEEEEKKGHERTKGKEEKRHGRKNTDGGEGGVQDKDDEKEGLWRKHCFTFCMGVAAVLCCLLRCAALCLPLIAELTKRRR